MRVDASSAPLRVSARLVPDPVLGWDLMDDFQSAGVMVGVGEDAYIKFALFHSSSAFGGSADNDPMHVGFQVGVERPGGGGAVEEHNHQYPAADGFAGVTLIDLFLEVNPATGQAKACYRTQGGGLIVVEPGLPIGIPGLFTPCTFAGLIHTNSTYLSTIRPPTRGIRTTTASR